MVLFMCCLESDGQASPLPRKSSTSQVSPTKASLTNNVATTSKAPHEFVTDICFKNGDSIELGDVIQGWVELSLESRVVVESICVAFYGEIRFNFAHKSETKVFERHSQTVYSNDKDNPNDISLEPALGKGCEPTCYSAPKLLEPGLHMYDFFVGTSRRLPPSHESAHNAAIRCIAYFCELEVTYWEGHVLRTFRKRKRICLHSKLAFHSETGRTLTQKLCHRTRNIWDMSGHIVATATLNATHYTAGDSVFANVEILNCFRVLAVYIELQQRAKCLINGELSPVTLTLDSRHLGGLRSGDSFQMWYGVPLWIPDPQLAPVSLLVTYPDRLVECTHWFVLRVKPLLRRAFCVEIPIVIDNSNNVSWSRLRSTMSTPVQVEARAVTTSQDLLVPDSSMAFYPATQSDISTDNRSRSNSLLS